MYQADTNTFQKFQNHFHSKNLPGEIEKKLWKRVYTYIPFLRFIPWILLVWVWNSLSMNACHENSDIDIFIITKKNRLWTVRILATLYFALLGQRKTPRKHAGKFCLSFFITEDALDFSGFAIKDDVYLYFRVCFLKPIIDRQNTYKKLLEIQKSWADFSEYEEILKKNREFLSFSSQKWWNNSKAGDIFEKLLKKIFLPKTNRSFEKLRRPFGVVIWDDILKFHNEDRRKEIRENLL